jgi:hypothetical protein
MPNILLSSYTIRLIDKQTGEMLNLDNFNDGNDLYDVIFQYLNNLSGNWTHDNDTSRLFQTTNINNNSRTLNGIISTGDYGYESDLINTQSMTLAHHRTTTEAEVLPFYFLINIKPNTNEGILLLERFGQYGIKTLFCKNLSDYFSSLFQDIYLDFYPILPNDYLSEFIKHGRITKIRLIKFSIPSDFADAFVNNGHLEEAGYLEYTIHAKKKGGFPIVDKFCDFLNNPRDLNTLFEIQDVSYDNVKVEIVLNGRRRTIDLSNVERFVPYYDITEDVTIGDNGHPQLNSIDAIAKGLLRDIDSSIGSFDV